MSSNYPKWTQNVKLIPGSIVLQNNFQYVEVKFYVKVAVLKSAFIVLYVKEVEFNKNNHTVNPL